MDGNRPIFSAGAAGVKRNRDETVKRPARHARELNRMRAEGETQPGMTFARQAAGAALSSARQASADHAVTDMKTPVRYSRGRLRFTGQIARASFNAWAGSDGGREVLESVAAGMRFAVFGRRRAARRRVWRQLNAAAGAGAIVRDVQREVDGYLERLDPIVYAHGLPRVGVDLHRLIVVPRSFANAEVYRGMYCALRGHPAFDTIEGGELVREWFVVTVVAAIAGAVADARPSPRRPLPAGSDWIVVGVNEQFEWGVPLDGPAWRGHYYLLELTNRPPTRSVRRAAEDAIARLETSLPSLTRVRRNDILRQATLSVEQLLARSRARAG